MSVDCISVVQSKVTLANWIVSSYLSILYLSPLENGVYGTISLHFDYARLTRFVAIVIYNYVQCTMIHMQIWLFDFLCTALAV